MRSILLSSLLIIGLAPGIAAAHPADGYSLLYEKERIYNPSHSYPAEWSERDIVFAGEAAYARADQLSAAEWYILGGAIGYDGGKTSLPPWFMQTYCAISEYYSQFHIIPETLDAQELRRIKGYEALSPELIETFKSPITNAWPRLRATERHPGDLYVRAISPEEKRYFANLNSAWKRQWYADTEWSINPEAGAVDASGPVFYFCVEGEHGPLIQELLFTIRQQ
jgi:hypothetical protein